MELYLFQPCCVSSVDREDQVNDDDVVYFFSSVAEVLWQTACTIDLYYGTRPSVLTWPRCRELKLLGHLTEAVSVFKTSLCTSDVM